MLKCPLVIEMGYNNKVVIHGGSGPKSDEFVQDLVSRLSGVASNCLEFVGIDDYTGKAPYALVWYQDGSMYDLFENMTGSDFRRVVLHDPTRIRKPTENAHVSVRYPGTDAIKHILKALNWNVDHESIDPILREKLG